jgi:threonine dehydrogenase-like Zn-dependent dehydrogenase
MGADIVLDPKTMDIVAEIRKLTGGRGVDVAIEALGTQTTFETALRSLRPGGTLSSLGVYAGKLNIPTHHSYARLCLWHWRLQDCHYTVSRRERTDATPYGIGVAQACRFNSSAHT